jgi:hypothetical protein
MTDPEAREIAGRLTNAMPVMPWIVSVRGYGEQTYYAGSRGKALAMAWNSDAFSGVKFGDFLKIANAYAGLGNFDLFGGYITVSGESARYVRHDRQYVYFVQPPSDVVFCSHPLDIEPPEYRAGTSYAVRAALLEEAGDA